MEKLARCAMILNTNLDIRFCVYILLYQPGIGTNGIIGTSSVWSVQALVSILTVLSVLAVLVLQPTIPLLIKTVVPI